jgi:hypothetical protein
MLSEKIFWLMVVVMVLITGILSAGWYFLIAYTCGGFSFWVVTVKLKNGTWKSQ